MIESRHKCSYCSRKRNEYKMYEVFYPLMHKNAWHCITCYEKIQKSNIDFNNNITLIAELKEKEEKKPPFIITEIS